MEAMLGLEYKGKTQTQTKTTQNNSKLAGSIKEARCMAHNHLLCKINKNITLIK